MSISPSHLELLARYDTPTISNVIELFEVRPRSAGYMDSRIRACFPDLAPVVGFASTATMRTAYPRAEGGGYNSLDEQVARFSELSGPPSSYSRTSTIHPSAPRSEKSCAPATNASAPLESSPAVRDATLTR